MRPDNIVFEVIPTVNKKSIGEIAKAVFAAARCFRDISKALEVFVEDFQKAFEGDEEVENADS